MKECLIFNGECIPQPPTFQPTAQPTPLPPPHHQETESKPQPAASWGVWGWGTASLNMSVRKVKGSMTTNIDIQPQGNDFLEFCFIRTSM